MFSPFIRPLRRPGLNSLDSVENSTTWPVENRFPSFKCLHQVLFFGETHHKNNTRQNSGLTAAIIFDFVVENRALRTEIQKKNVHKLLQSPLDGIINAKANQVFPTMLSFYFSTQTATAVGYVESLENNKRLEKERLQEFVRFRFTEPFENWSTRRKNDMAGSTRTDTLVLISFDNCNLMVLPFV